MQDSSKVWQEIWRQEYLSPKNLTWCDKNSKRQESSMVQQEPLVPRTSRDVTRTHIIAIFKFAVLKYTMIVEIITREITRTSTVIIIMSSLGPLLLQYLLFALNNC